MRPAGAPLPPRSAARAAAAAAAGPRRPAARVTLTLILTLSALGAARAQCPASYSPGTLVVLAPSVNTPPAFFTAPYVELFRRTRLAVRAAVERLNERTGAFERGELSADDDAGGPFLRGGARVELHDGESGVSARVAARTAVQLVAREAMASGVVGAENRIFNASGGAFGTSNAAVPRRTLVAMLASVSAVSEAVGLVAQAVGAPLVSFGSASATLTSSLPAALSVRGGHASAELPALLDAMRLAGWTQASLVLADDALGLSVASRLGAMVADEAARARAAAGGVDVRPLDVYLHLYGGTPADVNVASLDRVMQSVYASRRRVVLLLVTVPLHMPAVLRAARDAGVTSAGGGFVYLLASPAYRAVLGGDGNAAGSAAAELAGEVLGTGLASTGRQVQTTGWPPYERYAAAQGLDLVDSLELWAVDAVELLARALANATRLCRDPSALDLVPLMVDDRFDGVSGPVAFTPRRVRDGELDLLAFDASAGSAAAATAVRVGHAEPGGALRDLGGRVAWPNGGGGGYAAPLSGAPPDELPALAAGGGRALSHEAIAAITAAVVVLAVVAVLSLYARRAHVEAVVAKRRAAEEDTFHAFILHELRNPLNAVNSFVRFSQADLAQYAAARPAGDLALLEGAVADLSSATQSCDRVVEVLNNVMDLSKLATGAASLQVRAFSPRELLRDLHGMMRGVSKAAEVRLELGDALPRRAIGDDNKLRHVLANLLSNAVAATAHGYVALGASTEPLPAEAAAAAAAAGETPGGGGGQGVCRVRFEVRDTGKGIAPEQRRRLFEKYYSAGKLNGTGLGLYLCDQFVRLMGSRVEVESPWASDGSTGARFSFVLDLPLAPPGAGTAASTVSRSGDSVEAVELVAVSRPGAVAAAAAAPAATTAGTAGPPPEKAEAAAPRRLEGWRVLVADDLPMNRRILQRLLTRTGRFAGLGWTVTQAATGEEALELLRAPGAAYDLVVCDQNMGGAGGTLLGSEVAARLPAMGLPRAPLFVICSGSCSGPDRVAYAAAGAHLVWDKPLPPPDKMWEQLVHAASARRREAPGPAALRRGGGGGGAGSSTSSLGVDRRASGSRSGSGERGDSGGGGGGGGDDAVMEVLLEV